MKGLPPLQFPKSSGWSRQVAALLAAGFLGGAIAGLGVISAVHQPFPDPRFEEPTSRAPRRHRTLIATARVLRHSPTASAGLATMRAALFDCGASLSTDRPDWRAFPAPEVSAAGNGSWQGYSARHGPP